MCFREFLITQRLAIAKRLSMLYIGLGTCEIFLPRFFVLTRKKGQILSKEHFQIWLTYFISSVDELYDGPKAHEAKARAQAIASVMEHKVIS